LRILYITGSIDEKNGGPGTTTRLLSNELVRQGAKLDLMTFNVDDDYLQNIKSQCNFQIRNYETFFKDKLRGLYICKELLFINRLIEKYDVVLINGVWQFLDIYLMLATSKKIPIVLMPHGNYDEYVFKNSTKKTIFNNLFYKYLVKLSQPYFIALSKKEKDDIHNALNIKVDKIEIAPNGVYTESVYEKEYNIERKKFLYLGRFHEKKNIENTIIGFNIFNNNGLHVFELYGNYTELYRTLEKKYSSNNVKFMGYISGKEKEKVFKSSDCFILASYSEGVPMAALEAVSFGCKVLLSKECNVDFIEENNLGVYTLHKPEEIANSLSRLNFMKNNKYKSFLEYYSWENSAKTIINFFRKIQKDKNV
jgi:glycosyltransferase involved in cell wall biosynthesis